MNSKIVGVVLTAAGIFFFYLAYDQYRRISQIDAILADVYQGPPVAFYMSAAVPLLLSITCFILAVIILRKPRPKK